jgi:hypothetical protein
MDNSNHQLELKDILFNENAEKKNKREKRIYMLYVKEEPEE